MQHISTNTYTLKKKVRNLTSFHAFNVQPTLTQLKQYTMASFLPKRGQVLKKFKDFGVFTAVKDGDI